MPKTTTIASFGLFVIAAKQDSNPACSDLQPFAKIADLKTGAFSNTPLITMEPDFWLLDGNYKFLPANTFLTHVGLMSLSMSNALGAFAVPPVLIVTFTKDHNTNGLALQFSQVTNDYASSINVKFYDSLNAVISDVDYVVNDPMFSTDNPIEAFRKIVITFNSTNKAYRYLRLRKIDYGNVVTFADTDIKGAVVVEETSLLSTEIPIGTLELSLFSSDAAFSITNPTGAYQELRERQPFDVYETVGTDTLYIGQFFLDKWETKSETETLFKCIDAIGILDLNTYMGNIWPSESPIASETLIEDLMSAVSIPYELDSSLEGIDVTGWLPICSYREALQQISFAIGAKVYCARNGVVVIKQSPLVSEVTSTDGTILRSQKSMKQSLTLDPSVTGVELTSNSYRNGTESKQLFSATLVIGTHVITFSNPTHGLGITGGTFVETGTNYAKVNVIVSGTVTITGYEYVNTQRVHSVYNALLDENLKTSIIKIEDATLVSPAIGQAACQRIYDYYQQRYVQKVRLYAPSVEVGQSVLVEVANSKHLKGFVEKMSMNLHGGFVADAEIVGDLV